MLWFLFSLVYDDKYSERNGNKLGIINRFVRALCKLIDKHFDITGHRVDNKNVAVDTSIILMIAKGPKTIEHQTKYLWTNKHIRMKVIFYFIMV